MVGERIPKTKNFSSPPPRQSAQQFLLLQHYLPTDASEQIQREPFFHQTITLIGIQTLPT